MRTIFIFLVFVQIAQAAQLTPAQSIGLISKNAIEATSQNRTGISATLKSIVIPEIELEGRTMAEVLAFLDSKIKEHNPNINIIVIQSVPNTAPNAVAPPVQIDPLTGLPILNPVAPNINNIFINPDDIKIVGLRGKLRNLNILQIIELITLSFDTPVQFSVTNYGVMFFPVPEDQAGLVSRMFRVKANILGMPALGGSEMNQRPNTPGLGRAFR